MRPLRFFALALLLIASNAIAGTPLPEAPHVVANGRGKIIVRPDMAELRVSANIKNPSALVSKEEADRAVAAFMVSIVRLGIKPGDVTASALSVREDYSANAQGMPRANGFIANRSLALKIRDLDRLDDIMSAALKAGMTNVEQPKFTHSRIDALRVDARMQASRRVTQNATTLATAFNAKLGKVYSVNSVSPDPYARYGTMMNNAPGGFSAITVTGSVPTLIPEIEVEESMTAVYLLQP